METKRVSTQIIDHVDGQPSIVLSNGNWGVFDPKTNMYKDTGIKASPEDDSSAVKYYKLNNETTPPEAPSQTGGWSTLASLNASLAQAEWAEDPLQTSSTNRFCWIATYGKENIVDTVATEAEGHLVFKPKFTRTNVRLWSNYANSPTISVVGNEIIITNPDGTVIKQKFASTEAINDLTTLINSLQSQVDGAIYSYSMEGVPTLNTAPTTDWRLDSSGNPITDPATIADVYRTHVGDTYTDLLTYRSYRFSQTGSSSSNPSHYEWKIIEDDALSAALGEIARLGREKVTIFTEQPNSPYKKGDMWLDGDVMLHAIQSSEVFNLAHWVQPYATKVELDAIEADLQAAAADAYNANQNLEALETSLTNMTGTVADAIKDNIISDTELMDLESELKQLDIDQETLLTTVNYLLNSIYLPATPKATLQTRSNNSIAVGGSMDIYQAQVTAMIADRVITEQERANYLSKFNTYKTDLKLLNEAISGASSAIEGELKRLADEKVDSIEIGGRNLILNSLNRINFRHNEVSIHPIQDQAVSGENYRRFRRTYPEGVTDTAISTNTGEFFTPEKSGYYTYSTYFRPNEFDIELRLRLGASVYGDYTLCKANEWTQVSVTAYLEAGVEARLFGVYGEMPPEAVQWIDYNRVSVTSGTKAIDWTPAPEDVQAEIADAKKAGTDASAEVATMGNSLTTMVNTVTDALEDRVIDEAERKTLIAEQKTLDTEQERLLALVNSLLGSAYLVGDANTALSNASDVTLKEATGTLDVYQMTIDVMINAVEITDPMISAYEGAYDNHKNGLSSLNVAIENARKAIDIEVKRLADEKVDNIEIGGRNLILNSLNRIVFGANRSSTAPIQDQAVSGENYRQFRRTYPEGVTDTAISTFTTEFFTPEKSGYYTHSTYFRPNEFDIELRLRFGDSTYGDYILCKANEWTQVSTTTYIEAGVETRLFGVYGDMPPEAVQWIDYNRVSVTSGNKAADWTPAPEDVQAEIDSGVATVTTLYKHANEGVVVTKPTAANEVSSGWSETSPDKIDGQVIWSVNRVTLKNGTKVYSNPANIQGADGEGGINVMITRQGSFRTYWRQIGDQGQILTTPEKVSEIVGGVEVGGVKYVQCKVLIYKGSVDVTASALADPTTMPKWYLNNQLISGTDTLNIPIIHADGEDDEVRFEYTDTNAKNWKGA